MENISLHLHPSPDHISDMIRSGKFYEDFIFLEFEKYIPKHGTFLDIGANIGNHSMMFRQEFDNNIIAFEGNPLNYVLLYKNISQFKNIKSICIGLSDKVGLTEFIYDPNNFGGGGIFPSLRDQYPTIPVYLTTLDSFNFDDISFIKMDVENHEMFVIKGGLETIKRNKPLIWIEDFFYDNDKIKSPTHYLCDNIGYKLIQKIESNFLLKYE
jgi:FkbM family methyltransferase